MRRRVEDEIEELPLHAQMRWPTRVVQVRHVLEKINHMLKCSRAAERERERDKYSHTLLSLNETFSRPDVSMERVAIACVRVVHV